MPCGWSPWGLGPTFLRGLQGPPGPALPTLTVLSLFGTVDLTVTPVVPGDALVIGEHISVVPAADLPGGLNISSARAISPTSVRIAFTAVVAVAGGTMSFSVVAHR